METANRNRRVLVLGSDGKLGRLLRRVWENEPPAGWSPIWQHRDPERQGGHFWRPGDPTGELPCVSAVLALWGVVPGRGADLADNTRLAMLASDLAADLGAARVLHCSSAAVYTPGPDPQNEAQADLHPETAYGAAKHEMEQRVTEWARAHPDGPRICRMRIANVVGADSLFAALFRPGPVRLDRFADGSGPMRSYVAPSDLAHVFLSLLNCPAQQLPEVINIAGNAPLAMQDLALAAGAETVWRPAPAGATPMVRLDTGLLERLAGPLSASSDAALAVADWRRWSAPA